MSKEIDRGRRESVSKIDIFRILDWPWVYRLSQVLLAPGAEKEIAKKISECMTTLPHADRILDVGCGPSSWLWRVGLHPTGLDLSSAYTVAFSHHRDPVINGSACELPIRDHCFDGVWSIGLLHHLSDNMARRAVTEMLRVCRPGGYVAIFDAVLPEPSWKRPLAYVLRKADRGGYVRRQGHLTSILPSEQRWAIDRFEYASTGLEMLGCCAIR
jgi:ubiquinone/menaquinone biosynthesis C-methylase UbiE